MGFLRMMFASNFFFSIFLFGYADAQAQNQNPNQQQPKEYTAGELHDLRMKSNAWLDIAIKLKVFTREPVDKKINKTYREGMMDIVTKDDPKVKQYKAEGDAMLDAFFKKEAKKKANRLKNQIKSRRKLTKFDKERILKVETAEKARLASEFDRKLQIAVFKKQQEAAAKAFKMKAQDDLKRACDAIAAMNGKSRFCGS